ncbi:glycine--tRNA ligase subunit beta [Spiribacter vilamensis]|uniref:Glycine--tRNA ligase beta subunit n=1 Tax=Spiribacter vilamensis TaxID=531306 RepID=A0A4Q8D2A0_9GAMM|nr:glycine--tRNA ligase subunit beta [Spiribacter vilamensis]RZU99516.1 glycyl-tRNA synthetase beta chain [Spiribacter vilamensis]TVO61513.1 glycine--tRNA ligase subunit beta [Spiribacter vilamensis]
MSDETATLLFELGMEELPPGALDDLSDRLATAIAGGLERAGVEHAAVRALGAPRRLAVQIEAVARRQPDRDFERRGPARSVAFDDNGAPTRAAEGFARSCGVTVDDLQTLETDEGAWLVHRGTETGRDTRELLPGIIEHALSHLPIPKRMRWGDQSSEFVRPVHWVVLMLDEAVVPVTVFGVNSGHESRGHRFHHPAPVALKHADDYTAAMRGAHVLVDRAERRNHILEGVRAEGEAIGGHAVIDAELLDEVNALVEWPVVLSGSFDEAFLRVPPEALISSMEGHQRYFPVRDANGHLLPRFITVANIESRDPARVIAGNERVIRPRLADAAFFWDQDRARTLESRRSALGQVVFQKQLGSLADKSERVADLAARYADRFETDAGQARRAAQLAKVDLVTEMVDEFPELQGIMGRYYATEDGEAPAVAVALDEVYQPRFAADAIAASPLGRLLAVAERADTLTGIFAIGKAPTGAKDPFALRRAAVGLLRSLIEGQHPVDLTALLHDAAARQPAGLDAEAQVKPLVEFCLERLRGLYHEAGYGAELFEAVRSVRPLDAIEPLDFDRRLRACHDFARLPAAGSLAGANKRIRNILRKADCTPPAEVDAERLTEPAERALYTAMEERAPAVEALIAEGAYSEALARLAELREPVDRFFDGVMVMSDDPAVQANRLALLQRLQHMFLAIADVSALPDSG